MYFPDSIKTSVVASDVREIEEQIYTSEQKIILEKNSLKLLRKELRPKKRLLAKMRRCDARKRARR